MPKRSIGMDLQIAKKTGSRKLSIYEYFRILQIEWLVADLRLRLYTTDREKIYWKRVRDGKKETIDQIAAKNKLPTIFTDNDLKSELEHQIFRTDGFPNFHYKDSEQELSQGYLDLMYYYSAGSEVRFDLLGETIVGKIKTYQVYARTLVVTTGEGETVVETAKAVRLL